MDGAMDFRGKEIDPLKEVSEKIWLGNNPGNYV
jgi:hypothetical protein